MLVFEGHGDEAPVPFPAERRRDEVDHRPAEADEEAQAAGEVGDGEVRLRRVLAGVPGDDRFDGELRQGLQPGQDGQGQALRDQELRGLGAPGDDEGG